jgi:hypothetical protein
MHNQFQEECHSNFNENKDSGFGNYGLAQMQNMKLLLG